jgi:hypothetical protein
MSDAKNAVNESLMPQQCKAAAPLNLRQKLAAVMGEIGYIEKRGQNQQQHYQYAQAADIAGTVARLFAKFGVAFAASEESIEWAQPRETKNGGIMFVCRAHMRFTFLDSDSDERIEVVSTGEGTDTGDKSIYKAKTGALKYALQQTLLIATGDDPEDDNASGAVQNHIARGGVAQQARLEGESQEVNLISEAQQRTLRAQAHHTLDWDEAKLREFAGVEISEICADAFDAMLKRIAELGEAPLDPAARDVLVNTITADGRSDLAEVLQWIGKQDVESLSVANYHRIMRAIGNRKQQSKPLQGTEGAAQ